MHERRDGFDTVEWIHEQPWCDGNIGMIGRSYVGYTQWMAAADRPRGLKAIVPISPQADLYHGYPFVNGVFLLAMAELGIKGGRHSFQIRDFMMNVMRGPEPYFDTLPVSEMFAAAGVAEPEWWLAMMDHPNRDDYWLQGAYRDAWSQIRRRRAQRHGLVRPRRRGCDRELRRHAAERRDGVGASRAGTYRRSVGALGEHADRARGRRLRRRLADRSAAARDRVLRPLAEG